MRATADSSSPLLAYNLQTDASPLHASTRASITCVASNLDPTNPITVHSIAITISVGPTAADLTANASGIATPQPDNWDAALNGAVYTATPKPGAGIMTTRGVRLELDNIDVNDQIGATTLYLDENASDATHSRATRSTQFILAKFPRGFTLGSLTVSPTQIESGDAVSVMWTGTNMPGLVTYELKWVSQDVPRQADVDWIGPRRIENLDGEPVSVIDLEAHVAGAPPELRQCSVSVTPRTPVIDVFHGDLLGTRMQLTWSTRNAAECNVDGTSVLLDPAGTLAVPLDRFHFTLRARNRSKVASAELDLQFAAGTPVQSSSPLYTLSAMPDGSSLVALTRLGCDVYDGVTLAPLRSLGTYGGVNPAGTAEVSPDGKRVFVSLAGASGSSTLYDANFQTVQTGAFPAWAAAFSPDGTALFTVSFDSHGYWLRRFSAWRLEQAYEVRVALPQPWPPLTAACVSADGAHVFVFSLDSDGDRKGWLRRFNAATGEVTGALVVGTLSTPFNPTRLSSWRSGNKILVAAAMDFGYCSATLDAATLQPAAPPMPFAQFAQTAGEIIGLRTSRSQLHVDVVDEATLSTAFTFDVPTPFVYRAPMAVASGVFYLADNGDAASHITRYAATSANRRQ